MSSIFSGNIDHSDDVQDINLPSHLSDKQTHLAIDIGGSLAKIAYYIPNNSQSVPRLRFIRFSTSNLSSCLEFLKSVLSRDITSTENPHSLAATGGGSYRFIANLTEAVSSREITIFDEMASLISGVDYLFKYVKNEVFTYDLNSPVSGVQKNIPLTEISYPYLLVNIGSGVSIVKVTSPGEFKRVSGTSIGGGTFLGLANLLTGLDSFDEILELSQNGQNQNVDMLVSDIYGKECPIPGLASNTIASSMGKVYRRDLRSTENTQTGFRSEDLCASLLYTISNNIGQIAYLNATTHNISHIYFGGYFIRGHSVTMQTLQRAINFWSGGSIDARFLRHEGYLGAIGSLMLNSN